MWDSALKYWHTTGLVLGPTRTEDWLCDTWESDGTSVSLHLEGVINIFTGPNILSKNRKVSMEQKALTWGRDNLIAYVVQIKGKSYSKKRSPKTFVFNQ